MMTYRIRFYTGPVCVEDIADRCRAWGYRNVLAGTEHVHLDYDDLGDGWGALSFPVELGDKIKFPIQGSSWMVLRRWDSDGKVHLFPQRAL